MARASRTWAVVAAAVGLAVWGSGVTSAGADLGPSAADTPPVPVLVELFTSEGCSSCPPADTLLTGLAAGKTIGRAEIVALAFHVDYWDRLGWKDRFSSAAFTDRQNRYATAWQTDRIYTPQAVVDGRAEFTGSDLRRALAALGEAERRPHARVRLTVAPAAADARSRSLQVAIDPPDGAAPGQFAGDVLLAVAEDGLASEVTAGENARKRLEHAAVVRSLTRIGRVGTSGSVRLDAVTVPIGSAWSAGRLRAVVFVQDERTRVVHGTGQVALGAGDSR